MNNYKFKKIISKKKIINLLSIQDWPDETAAVDEFLKNKKEHLECFTWTNNPGAYLIKK